MAEKETSQLQKMQTRIEQLESALRQLTGTAPKPSEDPKERPDYVERGSDQHAALLGLKAAGGEEISLDGWTFEDVTQYGPAATKDFLMATLRQKVSELTSPMPIMQSADPRRPHFAPPIWTPDKPLSRITE